MGFQTMTQAPAGNAVDALLAQAQQDRVDRLALPTMLRDALENLAECGRQTKQLKDAAQALAVELTFGLLDGKNQAERDAQAARILGADDNYQGLVRQIEAAERAADEARADLAAVEDRCKAVNRACEISSAALLAVAGRERQ